MFLTMHVFSTYFLLGLSNSQQYKNELYKLYKQKIVVCILSDKNYSIKCQLTINLLDLK